IYVVKYYLGDVCWASSSFELDFVQFSLRNRQPAQAGSTQHVTLNRHLGEKPMSEKSSHPTDVDARWQGHHGRWLASWDTRQPAGQQSCHPDARRVPTARPSCRVPTSRAYCVQSPYPTIGAG